MAENKKSVLLYCDIIHTIKSLSDEEAGKLFKHYLEYINDLNPKADRLTELLFEPIKQNLKRDLKKWENQLSQRSESGKKGMEKRWHNKNNTTITNDNTVMNPITNDNTVINPITNDNTVINPITNITVTDTVNVTVTDKDILYKGNFFYIGLERYNTPISSYVKNAHQQILEVWQMQNKDVPIENVFETMDKECVGKNFTDNEHTINAFKWTYKDLKKGLKQFTPEQNKVCSVPKRVEIR